MYGYAASTNYTKTQNTFPHPQRGDLKRISAKGVDGIAYQIETNTASNDDFGNYTREVVILIFKELARSMDPCETLEQCFERIRRNNGSDL
jgi:hypothetical protein